MEERNLIPKHQFGFNETHSIINLVAVHRRHSWFKSKRYCLADDMAISSVFPTTMKKQQKKYRLGKLLDNLHYHNLQ